MKFFCRLIIFIIALLFAGTSSNAESIKGVLQKAEPVELAYGANNFKAGTVEVSITRALHQTETASSGDVFSILVRDKTVWQIACRTDPKEPSPLFFSQPHTFEDSVVSFRFFGSREQKGSDNASVFVLEAARDLTAALQGDAPTVRQNTPVQFRLYQLVLDSDFGIYKMKEINSEKSGASYCNADWALWKELAVPLPKDNNEYDCGKIK